MLDLYLIRHAQSANNALPESQRVEDPAITEIGERQATFLAERFSTATATHLLTSGFRRAMQTARPLAEALRVQPQIRTHLHEVGGCYRGHVPGKLEGRPGMNRAEIGDHFPEFVVPEDITESGWWRSQEYEDARAAQARAVVVAERLLTEFGEQDACVFCVIHADFKALLLWELLGELDDGMKNWDLTNTGVTQLRYRGGGDPEVVTLNDTSHLPEHLITL